MNWNDWKGKRIFVRLRNGDVYSGLVIDVDDKAVPLIFISITDKFGELVTFSVSEILKIKEEGNDSH